jgi:hypothetical protein
MRLSSVAAALLSVGLSPAVAAFFDFGTGAGSEVTINDGTAIPGESPLQLCDKVDHSKDTVSIERVDLSPNPPLAGQELVIEAIGTVLQPIEKGAYVQLTVKYGLIRLISTKADLCEQISNVDLECPVERGVLRITKSVELPKEIPPGKYSVVADVFNADDSHITCLSATVMFHRGGSGKLFPNFDL